MQPIQFYQLSISLLFLCSLLSLLFGIVILTLSEVNISLVDPIPSYAWPICAIGICLIILSLGMFDAVGIQFGMDQMVEASSDQISAFTHWYYWSMNIGIGVQALLVLCGLPLLSSCILYVKALFTRENGKPMHFFGIGFLSRDLVTSSSCISFMFFVQI